MKKSLRILKLILFFVLLFAVQILSQSIRLTWQKAQTDNIEKYRIYRKLQGQWQFDLIGVVSAEDTIFFDNELFLNTRVFYSVTCITNEKKESSFSRLATIYISDRFAPFGDFEVEVRRDDIRLSWIVWQKERSWTFEIFRSANSANKFERIAVIAYAPGMVDYRLNFNDRKLSNGNYFYKIVTKNKNGTVYSSEIKQIETIEPAEFYLEQNYPNPFNTSTRIVFGLGKRTRVRIGIFDISGREVKILAEQIFSAGKHEIFWDGTDESGTISSSGTYFAVMKVGREITARRIILLK